VTDSLHALRNRLQDFAKARDWEQFHTPKNLAMALIVEAAELVEHFQWLTPEESANPDAAKREEIALELADIQIYLIRIADVLGVDLVEVAQRKIDINEHRFPPST
jgi:dCTP diphosphatase